MVKKLTLQSLRCMIINVKKLLTKSLNDTIKMEKSEEFVEEVVCKTSDLKENDMKTFKLHGGDVLLVKQNNVISALGTTCTHYGAPLVKGALGKGRLRCPFHGACFNLSTGDIEDFPGIDSLPCHQVTVDGEDIKVKAKKSELTAKKRVKPMLEISYKPTEFAVVIGGGPAAAVCVETLRQENFGGEITMICKENVLPYDRVKCSKQMDLDISTAQFRDNCFYLKYSINVLKGVEATDVDTTSKRVILSNNTDLPYTKLFIATGSEPRKLSVPGSDLDNVFVVRNYEDAKAINNVLSSDKNLLVLGSSFMGMEVTDYCVSKVKKVSILMTSPKPLSIVLGNEIGDVLQKKFIKKGVEFISDVTICKINGREKIQSVELSDGTTLPADILIMCIGVIPSTAFLKNSGIKLEIDGTIATDTYLQTNIPDVYVGGDVALAPVWSNDNVKCAIGHFGLAHYHGKIAALNMAGKVTQLKTVPVFWTKLFGLSIRYCGFGQFDDIIYSGNVDQMKFLFTYLKNDKVIAMSSCGMDPYVAKFAELTAAGKKLYRGDVCGCEDPLSWAKAI